MALHGARVSGASPPGGSITGMTSFFRLLAHTRLGNRIFCFVLVLLQQLPKGRYMRRPFQLHRLAAPQGVGLGGLLVEPDCAAYTGRAGRPASLAGYSSPSDWVAGNDSVDTTPPVFLFFLRPCLVEPDCADHMLIFFISLGGRCGV